MNNDVLDMFNKPISIGSYVTGVGGYRTLCVGKVIGFTPTGMVRLAGVSSYYATSAESAYVERIREPKHSLVINKDDIPKKMLFLINTKFYELMEKDNEDSNISR